MKRIIALLLVSVMVLSAFGVVGVTAAEQHKEKRQVFETRTKLFAPSVVRVGERFTVFGTVTTEKRRATVDDGKVAIQEKSRDRGREEWRTVAIVRVDDGKFKFRDVHFKPAKIEMRAKFLGHEHGNKIFLPSTSDPKFITVKKFEERKKVEKKHQEKKEHREPKKIEKKKPEKKPEKKENKFNNYGQNKRR